MWCSDFSLQRLSAEFSNFDGTETSTGNTVPGIQIYHKMITVPDGCDTLYVIISATADEDAYAMWLTCKVDFAFCNPGPTFETDTDGWLAIQNIPGNFEDNSIHYTWCTAVTPGTHAVEIRMASAEQDFFVYLAAAHFYIDASFTGGGCVQAGPNEDPPGLLPTKLPPAPASAPSLLPTLPSLPKLP